MIRSFRGTWPKLHEGAYVDASAQVIGDVELSMHSSIWMNAVVRGDVNTIRIGSHTNIQDNCVVHVHRDTHPTVVGAYVTVGHSVTLHGCTVDDLCLIGMGAVILDGAHIGSESVVGAGALIAEGAEIPPRSLVMGMPGKVRRAVTDKEREGFKKTAEGYVKYREIYLREGGAADP